MPDSAPWEQVEELFYRALEIPVEARDGWLAEHSGSRPEVAAEAKSLLEAFEEQAQIEADRSLAVAAPQSAAAAGAASRFGPYEVERTIGQGGMGAVYLANRVDGQFRQRVAIKVVTRQGFGELFLERFRMERQILASLNHPASRGCWTAAWARMDPSFLRWNMSRAFASTATAMTTGWTGARACGSFNRSAPPCSTRTATWWFIAT